MEQITPTQLKAWLAERRRRRYARRVLRRSTRGMARAASTGTWGSL